MLHEIWNLKHNGIRLTAYIEFFEDYGVWDAYDTDTEGADYDKKGEFKFNSKKELIDYPDDNPPFIDSELYKLGYKTIKLKTNNYVRRKI